MRISIKLAHNKGIILPFDYQYAVQAWIYKVLSQSDAELASQLHDHGYPLFGKTFKLFCFSPWNAINYKIISGSGLQLLESFSELQVSFLIPEVMQSFVMGLFAGQSHRFFFKNAPSFDVVTNHIEIIQEPKWIDGPQDYQSKLTVKNMHNINPLLMKDTLTNSYKICEIKYWLQASLCRIISDQIFNFFLSLEAINTISPRRKE